MLIHGKQLIVIIDIKLAIMYIKHGNYTELLGKLQKKLFFSGQSFKRGEGEGVWGCYRVVNYDRVTFFGF